ncbi:SdpI family protein [Tissierella sp.]|uniref:SdpI family protein n=1 Tax=Tissierella sp. TaxID=41274 RepID=UPI00285AEBCD|nr:SdpI family protein [Tissierella sp.]MDR7857448.1 SdpI family protein [Tissierella sp.]
MLDLRWLINFIMPVSLIIYGSVYIKKAGGSISNFLGYRTVRSMLSEETWKYGNRRAGQIWIRLGLGLIIFSALYLLFISKDFSKPSWLLAIVSVLSSMVSLQTVDKELKEKFDEKGKKLV